MIYHSLFYVGTSLFITRIHELIKMVFINNVVNICSKITRVSFYTHI